MDDDGDVVLISMSDFGKQVLSNTDFFLMDGTFSCVPDLFAQLYVFLGNEKETRKYNYVH